MVVVKYWFLIASISLLSLAAFAAETQPSVERPAAADAARLSDHLAGLEGYRHPFVQQVYSPRGVLIESSEGELAVQRPKARWEIKTPFPQTVLLLDDELQIYDPDLEQVTKRALADNWADVPLAMLVNGGSVGDYFQVVEYEPGLFSLHPHADDSLLEEIRLEWRDERLLSLQIYDQTGQLTFIQFEHQSVRQMIQSGYFDLVLPPGTEVVRG